MNYKVFFAYQTDTDEKYAKKFIHSAIDIAIAKLKKKGINILLDFGFRGSPGTQCLLDQMLKKSEEADMVIVDLTFTSSKTWLMAKKLSIGWLKKEIRFLSVIEDKKSSNPNVLLEAGYAWAHKGQDRTLFIMNTAFGEPSELSVDLKGLRWPICFKLDNNNFYEEEKIKKDLANDFYRAFQNAIRSESTYQRNRWKPLKIYQDWNSHDFKYSYNPITEIKQKIIQLRNALTTPNNPQRILGPKNSGKTRMARELYNNIDGELPRHEFIEKVLYYDLGLTQYSSIEKQIIDLYVLNQDKVLILDNCPIKVHKKVCDDLTGSNVRILTIDELKEHDLSDSSTILIDLELAKKTVINTVKTKFSGKNANTIIELAQGNIREAMAFINSSMLDTSSISKEYVNKWAQLLGREVIEKGGLTLLESLSLFSHIGKTGPYQRQLEFIRESFCNGINKDAFYELLTYFKDSGMVKEQGDFIILETFTEELSTSFWQKQNQDSLKKLFNAVSANGLSKSLGNRLVDHSNGKGVFKSFAGEGIFDFNYVNTRNGSQLIMHLAEIAPLEIMNILETIFKDISNEQLVEFGEGRRNLVWALEKLCFRRETFEKATKLLFRLALAENEEIGNNATAQFLQLFQPLLAGTEVDLNTRLNFLIELYETND